MNTHQEFIDKIDSCETSYERFMNMLVFSDWLEEHNDLPQAVGWRYIVNNKRIPYRSNSYAYTFWNTPNRTTWFIETEKRKGENFTLPSEFFPTKKEDECHAEETRIKSEIWLANMVATCYKNGIFFPSESNT